MADAPKPSLRASLLAICGVLLLVGIVAGSRQRCGARSAVPASRALAQHGLCKPFEQLWEETDPKPQLSKEQMGWISTELYAAGLGRGLSTNLLVFGLGMDSILWRRINCHGRAVFLESHGGWMKKVLAAAEEAKVPLEAHRVEYNTTVKGADSFYEQGGWTLPVPEGVRDDCYEVTLVDAPQGFAAEWPGRMQSAHLALEIARRCVASGRLAKAALFLHDVNRELEQRIIKEQFLADPLVYALGTMKGEAGDLTGFELSKNRRPQWERSSGDGLPDEQQ